MHYENDRIYKLIDENRAVVRDVQTRVDQIAVALQVIVGAPLDDTAALVRFRDERTRLALYDRQITAIAERVSRWVLQLLVVGTLASGLLWSGIFDRFDWLKRLFS